MGASLLALAKSIYYTILKQWVVFFARSDCLLKLGISSAIHLLILRASGAKIA